MNHKRYMSSALFFQILLNVAKCSNLTDKAVHVADSTFDPNGITVVIWKYSDSVEVMVTDVLTTYHGSVVTLAVQNSTEPVIERLYNKIRVKQTIFIASCPENFEYMAKMLKKHVVNSIRAILILCNRGTDQSAVTKATKAAWEYDIGNIVVVTTDDEEETEQFWTYFPYGNGDCGNYTAVPFDLTTDNYFPRKFHNYHGCPIRVTLLKFLPYVVLEKQNGTVVSIRGIDGNILNLVMKKLNATYDIVSSTDHGGIGTMVNGTPTGSIADLVNNHADILLPAILLTYPRYPKLQFSYVYQTLDTYWCGPNQREIYKWAKVLLPFFTSITPLIIVTFTVFIVATKIIRRYALCRPERKRGVFFMSFVMFLGQEVNFETKCWLVNSLFIMWIWFCMIVRIAYQGDLVDGLQKDFLEPPLGVLEEAIDKVNGYGGVEVFHQYYKDHPAGEKFQALKLDEIPIYIKDIAEGKRFLIITDILLVKYFRETLQKLEKPVARAPVCTCMRAAWPAAEETQRLTFLVAETGLIEKIMDDFHYETMRYGNQSDTREAQPLTMDTVGALFYGLLAMFFVCFLIFCAELICHKYELKSPFSRKFKVK
ncbi:uncharacterized protein LOC126368653 [Pectinophora gossypiella]|uniref:uncharacterized protein LOC126368653 n=1 Tax=Pectinophora gossypiella TaxID=13191 RepID=UPI00214EDE85|nr:uncharacterized protein LOC126368653 [Pectinophora gossypiella]